MANLGKIVYLTDAQKNTLFSSNTVTVDGTTITYSDNDLYLTPNEPIEVSGTTPTITA